MRRRGRSRCPTLVKRNVTLSGERWTVVLRFAIYLASTIILGALAYTSNEPPIRIMFAFLAALMLVFSVSGLRFLLLQRRR